MQFFPSAYSRPDASLPEARLINMFFERTPGGPEQNALIQRPGLVSAAYSPANGVIRGMFKQDGTFSGELFSVSGNKLYRTGTAAGTLPTTTGNCRFAASASIPTV